MVMCSTSRGQLAAVADYCVSGVGPIFGLYSLLLPGMWACGPCLTSGVTDFNEELVLPAMRLYGVLDFVSLQAVVFAKYVFKFLRLWFVVVVLHLRLWLLAFF